MDASKTTRAAVGTLGTLTASATIADFNTPEELLVWAGGTVGGGAIVFAVVELLEKVSRRGRLNSDFKFYFAMALAFLVPVLAYSALVKAFGQEFNLVALAGAILSGYQISQLVHREVEKVQTEKEVAERVMNNLRGQVQPLVVALPEGRKPGRAKKPPSGGKAK